MSTNKTAQNPIQKNGNAHITFIGGGNMGRALISGLLASGFEATQISVVEANAVTALKLHEDFGVQGIGALADGGLLGNKRPTYEDKYNEFMSYLSDIDSQVNGTTNSGSRQVAGSIGSKSASTFSSVTSVSRVFISVW